MPEVGVVIPAWNAEEFLADAIESVQRQTFMSWHLVVVDDGSTDGTVVLARRYALEDPRITVVTQANEGVSAARNAGFEALPAKLEYCMFLDADDFLEPSALELLLASVEADDTLVGAHGLPREVDEQGVPAGKPVQEAWGYSRRKGGWFPGRRRRPEETTDFSTLVIWPCIETSGQLLIRTDHLRAVGPWRSMPGEDWEMWLRLASRGDFARIPEYVMSKRERHDSLSRNGKWLAQAEPTIRQMLTDRSWPVEQRRLARKGHLVSCWVKLTWVRDDLLAKRWMSALRNTYRWGRSSLGFIRLAWRY